MVSIRITSTGEFLDLETARVAYSLEAFDLRDLTQRKGEFSIDFDLPDTPANREKLSFASEDFLKDNTTYQRIDVELIQNGEIIKAGYLKIAARERNIEATFFSGASDWITLLEGSIRDVDLSDFDHNFGNVDIAAALVKTDEYVYPIIDYGTWADTDGLTGDRVNLTDLKPAIYARNLINIMFREIHWKVEGNFYDDIWFKRLVIPFSSSAFNHLGSWAQDRTLEAIKPTGVGQVKVGVLDNVTFAQEQIDTTNWDGTDTYTVQTAEPMNATIKVSCNFTAATTSPLLEIHVNAVAVATTTITGAGEFTVEISQVVNAGETIIIKMNAPGGTWTIDNGALSIAAGAEILTAADFEIASALPEISKRDFMRYIFMHRGVIAQSDNFSKTLTLTFFEDIRDTAGDDWTEKVDGVKRVAFAELYENYGQNSHLKYLSAGSDDKLKTYFVNNNKNYGDGVITIANEFLEKDVDIYTAPFAGTISFMSLNGRAYLPYIPYSANGTDFTEVQDPTFRILYVIPNIDFDYFIENGSIFFNSVGEKTVGTFAFFAKIRMLINIALPTPAERIDEGLAFDAPDDSIYSVGTISRYMGSVKRILQLGKIESFPLRLTEVDVRDYDITKPVFISGVGGGKLYYKNKVVNFEEDVTSTKVELIPLE